MAGGFAGFLASLITHEREGVLGMILLGIDGGLLGGWVATDFLKVGNVSGLNAESIIIATIGAIAILFLVSLRGQSRLQAKITPSLH